MIRQIFTGRNEVVAKVMFLHVSVILLTGGSLENPPQTRQTPRDQGEPPWTRQTPPGTKENPPPDQGEPPPGPGRNPPWDQAGTPPGPRRTPPTGPGTPPGEEHCSIRSMSGRYASYWNAFLLNVASNNT